MKLRLFLIFIIAVILFLGLKPKMVFAQTLSFDPTSKSAAQGEQFNVNINISTGSNQTSGADALITYDSNILTVTSVANGGFYTNFASNPLSGTESKYLISGFETDATSYKTGSGILATVTFTGKNIGTSTVSFDCSGTSKADSNILDSGTADDIINCGALASASYTVGAGSDGDGEPTNQPTPSIVPRSGSVEVTIAAVAIGVILTIVGLAFKL